MPAAVNGRTRLVAIRQPGPVTGMPLAGPREDGAARSSPPPTSALTWDCTGHCFPARGCLGNDVPGGSAGCPDSLAAASLPPVQAVAAANPAGQAKAIGEAAASDGRRPELVGNLRDTQTCLSQCHSATARLERVRGIGLS